MKHLLSSLALSLVLFSCKNAPQATESAPTTLATPVKFNGDSAFATLQAQCAFGERTPGSTAHTKCGDYIVEKFKALGLDVIEQKSEVKMWDGKTFGLRNIIAQYNPTATERIVIAAHWDSRPWADADKDTANHRLPVMAADDGASGVSVMLEVARLLKNSAICSA